MRIVSATSIVALTLVALASYALWRHHREESRSRQLWMIEIAVGENANEIKQRLGPSDLDLPTNDVAKYLGTCSNSEGVRAWRYFSGPNGGAYVFVYLDAAGRVMWVDKGLIAI